MNTIAQSTHAVPGITGTKRRLRIILRWTERILALMGLGFIIYSLTVDVFVITSGSMSPALRGESYETGDRVIIEKVSGWFRAPKRWEIYHYVDSEGTPVAKRVVGLPGEKISIRNNHIFINGVELPRPKELPAVRYYAYGNLNTGSEVNCGTGYFMLGDDSQDSYDSRFTGVVTGNRFQGRAWYVLWPSAHRGFVR